MGDDNQREGRGEGDELEVDVPANLVADRTVGRARAGNVDDGASLQHLPRTRHHRTHDGEQRGPTLP